MPNGFPYFLAYSDDYCQSCGEPLCDHDRERVYHGDGTYSYDYYCQTGREYMGPKKSSGGDPA